MELIYGKSLKNKIEKASCFVNRALRGDSGEKKDQNDSRCAVKAKL